MIDKTGEAATSSTGEAANILGTWALQVSSPFGMQPVTFTVERAGDVLTGKMSHERGTADVTNIKVHGADFTARAAVTLKGSQVTADIEGHIDGTQISGTVKVNLPVAPAVKFTGVKQ